VRDRLAQQRASALDVLLEPADGRRDGEITAEIRRGYRIGSRLIRPAMVKVAKA